MKWLANILSTSRSHPWISALIVYQFAFFNIVIPVHKRGMITMDGKPPACCCCTSHKTIPGSVPTPRDRQNCAICAFAAHVMPTPFPNLKLPELGLLQILPPASGVAAVSLDAQLTYLGRGPPTAV